MLSRWQSTIVDEQGNVQPLANLTVRLESDQSLAKMWASPGTTQPLPDGMLQADGNGYAFFYAEGGLYRITSAALGIDWRHVPLGELAGMDVADLGLGTAATRDVGTGANEVPANSNLGAAAYLPIATTSQAQELTNDATVITPKKLGDAMNAHVLGMGQTWQDVTSSRNLDTTYTNTTGRTIYVIASTIEAPDVNVYAQGFVNGVMVAEARVSAHTSSGIANICFPVPAGGIYRVEGGNNDEKHRWVELR